MLSNRGRLHKSTTRSIAKLSDAATSNTNIHSKIAQRLQSLDSIGRNASEDTTGGRRYRPQPRNYARRNTLEMCPFFMARPREQRLSKWKSARIDEASGWDRPSQPALVVSRKSSCKGLGPRYVARSGKESNKIASRIRRNCDGFTRLRQNQSDSATPPSLGDVGRTRGLDGWIGPSSRAK
jgi:hypothetical protein